MEGGRGKPIEWEGTIPLLTSRFYLADLVTAVAISAAAVHVLVLLAGLAFEGRPVLLPWQFGVFGGLGLLALFVIVTLVVFPGGVDATFRVDDEGVSVRAGSRIRKVNRGVLWLALLSGRAGTMGAAMLAQSREDTFVSYADVRGLWLHPGPRVI
ncbi:MAG: hypothetical protein FJ034_06995, partial [Chloroflexi bacterium]|nr:hypothetical protein [Chloroflexota bacterium]